MLHQEEERRNELSGIHCSTEVFLMLEVMKDDVKSDVSKERWNKI